MITVQVVTLFATQAIYAGILISALVIAAKHRQTHRTAAAWAIAGFSLLLLEIGLHPLSNILVNSLLVLPDNGSTSQLGTIIANRLFLSGTFWLIYNCISIFFIFKSVSNLFNRA